MLACDEELFRKIPELPQMFRDRESLKISTAAFKDSKGCSVDKGGGRTKEQIIGTFKERFPVNMAAVAMVTVNACNEINAEVLEKPVPDNIYHCEIHGSSEKIQLTNGQLKRLVDLAKIYKI